MEQNPGEAKSLAELVEIREANLKEIAKSLSDANEQLQKVHHVFSNVKTHGKTGPGR